MIADMRRTNTPRLPRIPGLDVAVHLEPRAAGTITAAFYDLLAIGHGKAGFVVGDVGGSEPDPALAPLASDAIRAAASTAEGSAAVLGNLNDALRAAPGDTGARPMCTAAYVEIDTSERVAALELSVAGHPAPLVVRADGSVEATDVLGPIAGAFAAPAFETCRLQLRLGDAIVVYSDGLLDVGGGATDVQRVVELLTGPTDARATDLVGRLASALRGVRLRDDVVVMALRWTSVG